MADVNAVIVLATGKELGVQEDVEQVRNGIQLSTEVDFKVTDAEGKTHWVVAAHVVEVHEPPEPGEVVIS